MMASSGAVRGRVGLVLDLKLSSPDLLEQALAAADRRDMLHQVVAGIRSLEQLARLRRLGGPVPALGLLADYADFPAFFASGGDIARVWGCDLTTSIVGSVRAAGKPLWVMAGTPRQDPGAIARSEVDRLLSLGIDGLLLNDPTLVLDDAAANDPT